MTEPEKQALALELKTPRGRVILTFLKELATQLTMNALQSVNAEEAFAHTQRGAGVMEAHKQLNAIANEPITGAYVSSTD